MSVILCRYCDNLIDLDWHVEHEGECAAEQGVEACAYCGTPRAEHEPNSHPYEVYDE